MIKSRTDAAIMLREAYKRLDTPQKNFHGGEFQAGGAYWRTARVLREFLEPELVRQEGAEHAAFVIATHGRVLIADGPEKPLEILPKKTFDEPTIRSLACEIVKAATHIDDPEELRKTVARLIRDAQKAGQTPAL